MCRIKKVTNKIIDPMNSKNEVAGSKKIQSIVVMRAKTLAIVAKMGDFNSFIILFFLIYSFVSVFDSPVAPKGWEY